MLAALAGALALGGLSACQPPDVIPPPPADGAPDLLVMLGDSSMAGPMIPPQIADPLGCWRSARNAAHLVVDRIAVAGVRDVSCSGATSHHMWGRQPLDIGGSHRPQLEAVDHRAKVVVVGIGINDIGVADVGMRCLTERFLQDCMELVSPGGHDLVDEELAKLSVRYARLFAEIHDRAPEAEVFALTYGSPPPGEPPIPADPPQWTDPVCELAKLAAPAEMMAYMDEKMADLDETIRARAHEAGVHVIEPSRYHEAGHGPCAPPDQRWGEPLLPGSIAAPLHMNALGHQHIADYLAEEINRVVVE